MSFARVRALRSLQAAVRPRVVAQTSRTQLVAKRFASSGGHGAHQASSDLPWAIGAVAVTIPGVYFLWPDTTHAESGHHGHGDEHKDEHKEEESEEKEEKEEEAPADEDKSGDDAEEKKSDVEEKEEPKTEEAPAGDDDSADGEDKKDATGKGKAAADSDAHKETRKTEDDNKGANKKRIDSGLAKNLGQGSASGGDNGKQTGLSNTDTKHSTKIDEPGSEKSTKSEDGPDTAKIQGAVDPKRPAK